MVVRPVFHTLGFLILLLAGFMLVPAVIGYYADDVNWRAFVKGAAITAFIGGTLAFTYKDSQSPKLSLRQAFLMTGLGWGAMAFFSALPFLMVSQSFSLTDAVFESMSGVTTTGATIIKDPSTSGAAILSWRSLLHWLGGIGFVVMGLSILPYTRSGGMQLFRSESSEGTKSVARISQMANSILYTYILLTLACFFAYKIAGMGRFDSFIYALSTISTGGFSSHPASIGIFQSAAIEGVATVFMLMGALPFALYVGQITRRAKLLFDSQVQWFLGIWAGLTALLAVYLILWNGMDASHAIHIASFHIASFITGTGFFVEDYRLWGAFPAALLLFIMTIGGCAGSTTCGIKIFRLQMLWAVFVSQMRELIQPRGVFIPRYGDKVVSKDVLVSAMGFLFMFSLSFAVLCAILSFSGIAFTDAISGAIACISNGGTGIGPIIGPNALYESLNAFVKWSLIIGMLLGRLELFTLLILFLPMFWRD